MGDSNDGDRIAEAILSDDPTGEIRYLRWSLLGSYRPPTKLRALGGLNALVALGLFTLATLRAATMRAVLGTAPLEASVSASVVLAAGLEFFTIGAVGLTVVGVLRARRDRSRAAAERLLGVEETVSLVGFVTGGLGALLGMLFFAVIGFADPQDVSQWVLDLVDPVSLVAPYGLLLSWASVLAVWCFAVSVALERTG